MRPGSGRSRENHPIAIKVADTKVHTGGMKPTETEITTPVDLCLPDGRLNRGAVGWSRTPLHRTNLRGWGRKKRWEYWAVQSPEMVLAVTVSDLDYAGLHAVWFLDPHGVEHAASALTPPKPLALPELPGGGAVSVSAGDLDIKLEPNADGMRIIARTPQLHADITITRPTGHQSMAVVVPWSDKRFQYTVKENTLPARGTVTTAGASYEFGEDSWATWDFGRGKWPYRITWNWGSGSGRVGDHVIGLQVGGAWTDGTGSTENALMVDGVTHKISEELLWSYRTDDWMAPWRITSASGAVDLRFEPSYVRSDHTELGVIGNYTHQCFGTWSGSVRIGEREWSVDGLRGWAEEVRNRW